MNAPVSRFNRRDMIGQDYSFTRLRFIVELEKTRHRLSRCFSVEPLDAVWAGATDLSKDCSQLVVGHLRNIVEVQNICRTNNPVFHRLLLRVKPMVAGPGEVDIGRRPVIKFMRFPNLLDIGFPGPFNTQLVSKNNRSSQVFQNSICGAGIRHLNNSAARFIPHEAHLHHVSVQAEEVEHPQTVKPVIHTI